MRRRKLLKLGIASLAAFTLGFHARGLLPKAEISEEASEAECSEEREVPPLPEGRLFIEVHDLSPFMYYQGYQKDLDDFLDEVRIRKREYFLIPATKEDINVLKHSPEFVDYVKERIIGKFVLGHHGLTHWPMDYENMVFEFSYLNEEDAARRCEKALSIHEEVFKTKPDGGEAPPNWSYSTYALKGFLKYYPYVSTDKMVFFRDKLPLLEKVFEPTWNAVDPDEKLKEFRDGLEYYRPQSVRLVFHPQDTKFEGFRKVALKSLDIVEGMGYSPSMYKELL